MKLLELKEALTTLHSVKPDAHAALLTASAGLVSVMAGSLASETKLKVALESEEGIAMTNAVKDAQGLVPWFQDRKDVISLALAITNVLLTNTDH